MKNIKRLANEKISITKNLKDIKLNNDKLKSEILSITELYEVLQSKYDETAALNHTDGSDDALVHVFIYLFIYASI
jgi:hypothetical protein